MVLAFKVAIGGFLWSVLFLLIGLFIGGISYVYVQTTEKKSKKPKYEGDPIVIKGGKKKDE
jgi:hypothetical protein